MCALSVSGEKECYMKEKVGRQQERKNRIQLYEGHGVSLPIHSVEEEVTYVQTFHFFFCNRFFSLRIPTRIGVKCAHKTAPLFLSDYILDLCQGLKCGANIQGKFKR